MLDSLNDWRCVQCARKNDNKIKTNTLHVSMRPLMCSDEHVMPNRPTHCRRQRDSTVELSRVGVVGVNRIRN